MKLDFIVRVGDKGRLSRESREQAREDLLVLPHINKIRATMFWNLGSRLPVKIQAEKMHVAVRASWVSG